MPDCCIKNCDRAKSNTVYFKFPLHDPDLLQKWLKQIGKPHWTPTENNFICANHFHNKDIINNPKRKYLILKEGAVPMIFPKAINYVSPSASQQSEVSIIKHYTKSDISVIPTVIQTTPLILTPTIVEPLTTMDSSSLPLSNTSQRFRKILPKLEQKSSAIQNSSANKNDASSSTSAKYIILIPTYDNTKSLSIPNNRPKLPLPNKKKSILRITISRKYNEDDANKTESVSTCSLDEPEENNAIEEVVINHETLNKLVVYSLNRATNQISVHYRDNTSGRNSKLQGTHMTLRENPPKRKSWDDKLELGYIYKRVKRDCSTLQSKLRLLRQKHQKEKEEIERLQEKLAEVEKNKTTGIDKSVDTPKVATDIVSLNKTNKQKFYCDEIKQNIDQAPVVNKQMHLSAFRDQDNIVINGENKLRKSINICNEQLCSRKQNGYCNSIEIDYTLDTGHSSDLKLIEPYKIINDPEHMDDRG